jgi:hypothetical protein
MGRAVTMSLDFEFGKASRRQAFGEYFTSLIKGRNELDKDITSENFFPDKVIVYLDMFGASMVDRIRSKCDGRDIVTPQGWCTR